MFRVPPAAAASSGAGHDQAPLLLHLYYMSPLLLSRSQVLDTIMAVFSDGEGQLEVAAFTDAMKRKLNTVHASKFAATF